MMREHPVVKGNPVSPKNMRRASFYLVCYHLDTHLGQIKVPTLTIPLLVFWVRVVKHLETRENALKRGLGN